MVDDHVCPIHRARCVERSEENYFFALSKYQKQIEVRPLAARMYIVLLHSAKQASRANRWRRHPCCPEAEHVLELWYGYVHPSGGDTGACVQRRVIVVFLPVPVP